MKYLMNYLILILALSLGACGGGKGGGISNGAGVTVEGNIENVSLVWQNLVPNIFKEAYAAGTISTRSELVVNNPTRLPEVSVATGIAVESNVINSSNAKITGFKVDIEIEDEQQLTKEFWSCGVTYQIIGGGTTQQEITRIEGNTIFESEPNPTLPNCDSTLGQQDICVTIFQDGIQCATPVYEWTYFDAGDGLQKFTMENISVNALSSLVSAVSQQSGGWPTGTNKYARFTLYNSQSIQVQQKDYVFNVID